VDGLTAQSCPSCGTANVPSGAPVAPAYIYSIGRIEPRFPRPSIEKEFAQAIARSDTKGLTDRKALHSVLSKPENRYLVRQMCWVMCIGGLDTYILFPRDPSDLHLLVETMRANPGGRDLDVVIGVKGPMAPADLCNGLMVPVVGFDQIYSFDRDGLIDAIPKAERAAKDFRAVAEELFDRIMQITDNAGSSDEHRALNYLALRYHAVYARAAEALAQNSSLSAVEVKPSPLSGVRKIVDVVFSYTNRTTDVTEKSFVRVDVSEEFPYLVAKLSPYYDR